MKNRVRLSTWCTIMTLIGLIVLLTAFYFAKYTIATFFAAAVLIILCATALFFMPLSISVNDNELNINRPLKIKSIPMNMIASVKLWSPTMAKNATMSDYRKATGFEALVGWLYVRDEFPRVVELVRAGVRGLGLKL